MSENFVQTNFNPQGWAKLSTSRFLMVLVFPETCKSILWCCFQSDFLICYCLTASDDILILETLQLLYIQANLQAYLIYRRQKGAALKVDGHSEFVHLMRIRLRLNWHGEENEALLSLMLKNKTKKMQFNDETTHFSGFLWKIQE